MNISNDKQKKVTLIFLIVIISMSIVAMIMVYDYYQKSHMQYNFDDPNMKMTFGIMLVIGFIVIYDIFIKKKRRGNIKGGIRCGWTEDEKESVRNRQGGACNKCGRHPPRWDHHRDGNRGNNSLSNCEGLCPNCHSVKTHD